MSIWVLMRFSSFESAKLHARQRVPRGLFEPTAMPRASQGALNFIQLLHIENRLKRAAFRLAKHLKYPLGTVCTTIAGLSEIRIPALQEKSGRDLRAHKESPGHCWPGLSRAQPG
jgi:hypothetical protein